MFETDFKIILSTVSDDQQLPVQYVEEVVVQHQKKGRYYHTLAHLQAIWQQLQPVKELIQDWSIVVCALAYHDFEYNILKNDNEEKSAEFAIKRLRGLRLTPTQLERCRQHIRATKGHHISSDTDTNYFTDADLSILGADPELYIAYAKNIRREYRYYPNLLYNPGRRKVLDFFLQMPRIFKTDHFYRMYENKARINLAEELKRL